MPYHGTFYGRDLEKYVNSYDAMGAEPREKRGEKWNELSKRIDVHGLKYANDITKMKADYLIRAINQAVDTWNASRWCKEYDKSVFFDYVLPYRVANEPLSNGADGQNQYIVDCWNSITSEKGHTVYYCGDCSLLDGRRQITSRSGECVYTEKD